MWATDFPPWEINEGLETKVFLLKHNHISSVCTRIGSVQRITEDLTFFPREASALQDLSTCIYCNELWHNELSFLTIFGRTSASTYLIELWCLNIVFVCTRLYHCNRTIMSLPVLVYKPGFLGAWESMDMRILLGLSWFAMLRPILTCEDPA